MSIVFPNRTFAQTFPCGTSTSPCKGLVSPCDGYNTHTCNGYIARTCNGYCPVDYDNFASDSPAPFFLEKYRELVDVLNNCRTVHDDNVCYYTPVYTHVYTDVYTPVNQYVTVSRPYKLSDGVYPRRIKERYYRVQY